MINIYEDRFVLIYCIVLFAILGAVMGSFLNCAAWRIAHGESFLKGKSHCAVCGHELAWIDLIPLLSWIMSGGKCRYCKEPISVRYPLTELFFAAMSVLCLLRCNLSFICARNFLFGCVLFCLSLVDLEIYEIPDVCHIISILVWLGAIPFMESPLTEIKNSLLGAVVIGGSILVISLVMDKLLGRESMGGGDIKLLFVSGLYLGLVRGLFMLIAACIIGLLFYILGGKRNEEKQFPFGPAIAAATWIMLLFGQALADWYLGLIF